MESYTKFSLAVTIVNIKMKKILILLALTLSMLQAQSVYVKYRGTVNTDTMTTKNIGYSSFVNDIKYNAKQQYLLVKLNNTYYHYCAVPQRTVNNWISSSSLGSYYNTNIKGNYDCRIYPVPIY